MSRCSVERLKTVLKKRVDSARFLNSVFLDRDRRASVAEQERDASPRTGRLHVCCRLNRTG
ncbi:protein of unknown function (plasmid) [Pararobbsia alpina]